MWKISLEVKAYDNLEWNLARCVVWTDHLGGSLYSQDSTRARPVAILAAGRHGTELGQVNEET